MTDAGSALDVDELRRLGDRVASTLPRLPYDTWNFGDSVAFEAMIEASELLERPELLAFAHGWIRAWATRGQPFRRMDCTAPGLAMVRVAQVTGDAKVIEAAVRLADYLMARPSIGGAYATWEHSPLMHPYGPAQLPAHEAALLADPPPGVFIDCLHFDPPFLTALGAAIDQPRYWRAGLDQASAYIRLLRNPDGLFDHFVLEGYPGTYGPGWGRGQGWALLGLLDVLESVPGGQLSASEEEQVATITEAAAGLVRSMIALQRADGHWNAVVTDPESGDEFSTAAFMAYGFRRAIALGVVTSAEAGGPAELAAVATARGIDDSGALTEVSAAVMACTEASHYSHVPRNFVVPWGQGPAVLALLTSPA